MTAPTGQRFGTGARTAGKHASRGPSDGSLLAALTAWLTFAASVMSLAATLLAQHAF